MTIATPLLAASLLLAQFPPTSDRPSIGLHVATPVAKNVCDEAVPRAADHVTERFACSGDVHQVYVFVCSASESLGVAGMEFGFDYDGIPGSGLDPSLFTLCADQIFSEPGWPDAGTGAIITWDAAANCQNTLSEPFVPNTVIAQAGVLTVTAYSPDQLRITERPFTGLAAVADCFGAETVIDIRSYPWAGIAGFCMYGYNTCANFVPVRTTTWGGIKSRYRDR